MNLQHTTDKVAVGLSVALSELMRLTALLAVGCSVTSTMLIVMSVVRGNITITLNLLKIAGPIVTIALVTGVGHFLLRAQIKRSAPVRPPLYG